MYKGERAFLIAGGPSLRDTNLSLLTGELIYAVGLTFKANLPHIDCHFIGDRNITQQFYDDINHKLALTKTSVFTSKGIYKSGMLTSFPNIYYFDGHGKKKFHIDITKPIYGGGTSTFLAMQFAYYMGIKELYIVGLDHYWNLSKTKRTGKFNNDNKELLIALEDDENHFTEEYYIKGTKFYTPSIEKMEESYRMARVAFEKDGRVLLNASLKTKLSEDIIKRIDFYSLF
jgi:hypothetical protein